jgi:hypothetical protein
MCDDRAERQWRGHGRHYGGIEALEPAVRLPVEKVESGLLLNPVCFKPAIRCEVGEVGDRSLGLI